MSRRGDTNKWPLPGCTYIYEAVPPRYRDDQYPHDQKSTDKNDRNGTDQATDSKLRKVHRELQDRSEMKRREDANEKAYRACRYL